MKRLLFQSLFSLRKHPFLLALCRWGCFMRRNVCDSATEIPYWWRKICPESGWSTEKLHCSSFCLRMIDKRQKATKVKCKSEESLTKQVNICGNIVFSRTGIWVLLDWAHWQMNTTLYQNHPEDSQNWKIYFGPHDYWIYYVNIDLHHQYGISAA